jgi:hypothetical protein
MDHDVIDVLFGLGCFSAGAVPDAPEPEEDVEFDDLWIDLGGEG